MKFFKEFQVKSHSILAITDRYMRWHGVWAFKKFEIDNDDQFKDDISAYVEREK